MTTARWWAPTEPHLGPDEIDLAMLEVTGGNARLDLGGVLLAAHRVGDAACQVAASTPLCDEGTLAESLARARSELAGHMIDSVSKCVSEGDSYAGLLVRDVLDSAETATLEIYRSAVSRGVAGSVAAARAGAVFGVPATELARYRTLAIDPKSNPALVTETADKAVFKYFAELAETETTQPVAKATEPRTQTGGGGAHRGHDWVATEERDDSGRWTSTGVGATMANPTMLARLRGRYGIGSQTPPEVATGRPSETVKPVQQTPPEVAEPKRPVRDLVDFKRKQQLLDPKRRPRRSRSAPERATRQRTGLARATRARESAKRLRKRDEQAAEAIIVDTKEPAYKPPKQVPKVEFRAPERGHHLLDKVPDDDLRGYERLDEPVAVVIPLHEARYLNSEAKGSPGSLFRVHNLLGLALNPNGPHTIFADENEEHEEALDDAAATADGTHAVHHEYWTPQDGDKEAFRMQIARQGGDPAGKRTQLLPDIDESSERFWAVTRDPSDALPLVFEYVLHGANAAVDWGEREQRAESSVRSSSMAIHDYRVDPNQAFQLPDATSWQKVYDPERGVVVQRVNLRAVTENDVTRYRRGDPPAEIEKAVEQVRRPAVQVRPDDPATPYYDARDSGGRFASGSRAGLLAQVREKHGIAEETEPVPEAPPHNLSPDQLRRREALLKPKPRPRRSRAKPSRQTPGRAAPARPKADRAQRIRDQLTRTAPLTEAGQKRDDIQRRINSDIIGSSALDVDENYKYRIMDQDEMHDIIADNATFASIRDGVIRVRDNDSLIALESHQLDGQDVASSLRRAHWDVQTSADGLEVRVQTYPSQTLNDQIQLARTIQNKLSTGQHGMIGEIPNDENPDAYTDVATPQLRAVNGDFTQLHMSQPPSAINLVEFDPGLAGGSGNYDLVKIATVHHISSSEASDDYTGDARHHYFMVINRWLAVDPSETESVMRELRSRSNDESGR